MKKETKIGTYRKNQKGFGFVKIEEQEDEVFIAKNLLPSVTRSSKDFPSQL